MDNNQIVIYQTEDGLTKIEVNFDSETVLQIQTSLLNYTIWMLLSLLAIVSSPLGVLISVVGRLSG